MTTCLRLTVLALVAVLFPTPLLADIACVQTELTRLGFDPGPVDGRMGGRTASAAADFADKAGMALPALGNDNGAQWCRELRAFAEKGGEWKLNPIDLKTPPRGVLSQADSKRLWNAYKTAGQCFRHPVFGRHPDFAVSPPTAAAAKSAVWRSPFTNVRGNAACTGHRPDFNLPPAPIPVVKLDETYGERNVPVDIATDWFRDAATFVRLSGDPVARQVLKDTLLDWARAGSLGRGIHVSWGKKPVDYQMMTAIAALVAATAEVASDLKPEDRAAIGPWLGGLVAQASRSQWKDRQDNKEYMRTYIGLVWALMTGDRKAVDEAVNVFKLAINDMRPDGSFPVDSQRSGMGIHYNSFSAGYLVLADAALREATGEDLFSYRVDGRSGHDAAAFVVRSVQSPAETNRIYAIGCKEGGDRFGSPDNPNLHFIREGLVDYLLVYAGMYPDSDVSPWIMDNMGGGLREALMFEGSGGAPACQFAQTGDPNFSTEPVVVVKREPRVLPRPQFVVEAREELAHDKGKSPKFNSLFHATVKGAKGGGKLNFNLRGLYDEKAKKLYRLEFVINQDNVKEPAGVQECNPPARVNRYNATQHGVVIGLVKHDDVWTMPNAECVAAALPKKSAFMVRFLASNFRDIAIGMVKSGSIGGVQNDGLKELLDRVAYGEVAFSGN